MSKPRGLFFFCLWSWIRFGNQTLALERQREKGDSFPFSSLSLSLSQIRPRQLTVVTVFGNCNAVSELMMTMSWRKLIALLMMNYHKRRRKEGEANFFPPLSRQCRQIAPSSCPDKKTERERETGVPKDGSSWCSFSFRSLKTDPGSFIIVFKIDFNCAHTLLAGLAFLIPEMFQF